MRHGMIELLVLSAVFLQGPIVNLANTMETSQFPKPNRSSSQTYLTVTGAP